MKQTKKDMLSAMRLPAKVSKPKGGKVKSGSPGDGSPFELLSPFGGEIYEVGSNVGIYWTGGPATQVQIYLSDSTDNAAIALVGSPANVGIYHWTIPLNFHLDHTHEYGFYIQDVGGTMWDYGALFRIT